MSTRQTTIRFPEITDRQLTYLAAQYGDKTKAVVVAIDRLHQAELKGEETMSEKIEIVQIDTKPEPDPYKGGGTYAEFWLDPTKRACGISQECNTGSTDTEVWHGRILTVEIPNPEGDAAKEYLENDAQGLLLDIVTGHSIDWDGHNMRGGLTEKAEQAWLTLTDDLRHLPESDWQMWNLDDYLGQSDYLDDIGTKTDEELEALAIDLEAGAKADCVTFSEDLRTYLKSERELNQE